MSGFQIEFLNKAIVGVPGPTRSQATTSTSAEFVQATISGIEAGKLYLFNSDKVCHLKFGTSLGTAAPADSFRLPPNQIVAVSSSVAMTLAIIRGANEASDGTLWVSEMLVPEAA